MSNPLKVVLNVPLHCRDRVRAIAKHYGVPMVYVLTVIVDDYYKKWVDNKQLSLPNPPFADDFLPQTPRNSRKKPKNNE